MQALRFGVPVHVDEGGDLEEAMNYGNQSSTLKHKENLQKRLMADLSYERVVVLSKLIAHHIRNTRISPLAVVETEDKCRVILDLSFGAGGGGNAWLGVNRDTEFDKATECEIAGILNNFHRSGLYTQRELVGPLVPIYS